MPHFLAHGKTVMVEWGWVYDKNSLVSLPTFIDSKNKIINLEEKNFLTETFKKEKRNKRG